MNSETPRVMQQGSNLSNNAAKRFRQPSNFMGYGLRNARYAGWLMPLIVVIFPLGGLSQDSVATHSTDKEAASKADFDIRIGKRYVNAFCSRCHGRDGKGARGPDLTTGKFRYATSDEELLRVIQQGIPGTDMQGRGVFEDIQLPIIAYLRAAALQPDHRQAPSGNAARGYELFKENQCASCHWTGNQGGRQGPNLSRLTAPPDYVRNSMLDPNSQVDLEYQQVILLLDDDKICSGRRLHENSYFLLLMDQQENLHAIDKRSIREIKRPHESLMPSFSDKLSRGDIEDITTYIYSIQQEPRQ